MNPCHTCACFAKRGEREGACVVNPILRRGITPGCDSYQPKQLKLGGAK